MDNISQCIYCDAVYEVDSSNSTVPKSCCSKSCEELYEETMDEWEV